MIRYTVRSRDLVDIVNDIRTKKLILSPHFQRNLVWRDAHKSDFIETILLRYPFPQIFQARGDIDVDTMVSTSCIVDGQQRLNAILEFIDGKVLVHEKGYADLTAKEKEHFLRYEIALIELDLAHDDPQIIEIFKRLNRTFYALSTIEKQATEYAASEFMLLAKLLSSELEEPEDGTKNVDPELFKRDPNVSEEFVVWGNSKNIDAFRQIILNSNIFSKYEISRMVHLNFTLNILATAIGGYYNRNELVADYLDTYKDSVPDVDNLVARINRVALFIEQLKILTVDFWLTKANFFTLFICLYEISDKFSKIKKTSLTSDLKKFPTVASKAYLLAAREALNNKQQRVLRHADVMKVLNKHVS